MTAGTAWRPVRRVLFWMHLATGICAGLLLAWMAASGCVLAYQRQALAMAERGIRVAPTAGRLPLEQLVARGAALAGSIPPHLMISRDPALPVRLLVSRFEVLDLDPATGAELGHGAVRLRRFFATVEDLHRSFGIPGRLHVPAHRLKEAVNIGFLFLLGSGLLLWWPVRLSRRALRAVAVPRLQLQGKARNWNLHHVLGIWFLLPLLVMVGTGVVLSYDWASDLLFRLTASPVPQPEPGFRKAGAARVLASGPRWQPLLEQAEARVPDWRTITFDVPDDASGAVRFTIDSGDGAHAPQQAQLALDPATGATVRWQSWALKSRGLKLRELARWTHTGESLGLAGQTLALITALAALALIWTGFALALARLQGNLARRGRNRLRLDLSRPPADPSPRTT